MEGKAGGTNCPDCDRSRPTVRQQWQRLIPLTQVALTLALPKDGAVHCDLSR